MIGTGTIINVAGIVLGGVFGLLLGKKFKKNLQDTLMNAVGASVIIIGIGGSLEKMLSLRDGELVASGSIMLVVCLSLGSVIGELLRIESGMVNLGRWLKEKSGSTNDNNFVTGFIVASLTVCVGAMAIVGSIEDGINNNISVLAAKGIIDFVLILIMTASYGKGCMFSAIPVGVFQGAVTLLARFIQPILTETAISNISFVGSAMILCVGINVLFDKKIRLASMLPSIVLAALWAYLPF